MIYCSKLPRYESSIRINDILQTSIEENELIVKQVKLFKTKVDELEGKEVSEENPVTS